VAPSKYVVATWGKKGSDDRESPMPAVDKPPIQLSKLEMDAIIAYLQAKDGNEVTVSLPSPEDASAATAAGKPAQAGGATTAATAAEAIAKHACQACHALLGSEATLGPSLEDVGDRMDRERLRASIVDPNAEIAEGFTAGVMPADFGDRMTAKELEMVLTLLESQRK
jgi:mono/diheme cytochrome c family protein